MKTNKILFLTGFLACVSSVILFAILDLIVDDPPQISVYKLWALFSLVIFLVLTVFIIAEKNKGKQVLRGSNTC